MKYKGNIKVVCVACGKEFFVFNSTIKKGGGKYCCHQCYFNNIKFVNNSGRFKNGGKNSNEVRQKISKKLKGKPFTEEHKKNLSISQKGRKLTLTHLENIRLSKMNQRGENSKLWKGGKDASYQRRRESLKKRLRERISQSMRNGLKYNKKGGVTWKKLVPYNYNQLKKHLEKTMPEGYTWQDFMDGKLHIDHIIPVSFFYFTKSSDLQFQKCWALDNLRLLPAQENFIKNDKLIKPHQMYLAI